MEEKTSKAPSKASGLSHGLGDRLRRWTSPQSPILRPFPIIDDDAINPRQHSRLYLPRLKARSRKKDDPATLSGSRPPTPHVLSNITLPKPRPTRKGVAIVHPSRPAGAGSLWSVEPDRWDSMSHRDRVRFYHVDRIMSEELGQPAVQKCKECERPTKSLVKMNLLKQCRVYKDRNAGVAQCAGCLYSHKRCTFAERAPNTHLSLEGAQLTFDDSPEKTRPDFLVGPTSESVPTALEQLSGSNWLGNTSINLLLKNVILLNGAHVIEIANPPGNSAGWQNFSGRYTAPAGCRLVLVPLYLSSYSHWTLLALDLANSRATFYDSLGLSPKHDVEAAGFAIVKAFGRDWEESGWSLHHETKEPLQGDSHSCGLVVLVVCMHLVARRNIPKVVNFRLWRFLFRRALGEADARLNLTEAASNDDCRVDVQGPSSSQPESHNLSRQVEDAINLISLLRSQATIEQRKLHFALSRIQDQNESAEGNIRRLGRKMALRQAQLGNLLRAQDAANDLHEALESRLDDTCFGKDEYFSQPPKRANGPRQVGGGAGQRSATQRPSYATNDVAATLKLQPLRWDTVLWVTVPDNPPFTETNTLSIQYFPGDVDALGHDIYLREALRTGLGHEAVKKEDGGVYVHQGLATILAARSKEWFSVRLYRWDWLVHQLQKNLPLTTYRGGDGQPHSTVVFIHATTEESSNMSDVYQGIRYLAHAHGVSIRPYPSESEWRQQRIKIGDVRALDEIARLAPTQFSYRPKTCFGQGPCLLLDRETTVHKRSHSSGATHVMVREKGSPGELACMSVPQPDRSPGSPVKERMSLRPRNNPRKRAKSSDAPESCERKKNKQTHENDHSSRIRTYWFHQEFVRNLYEGEFRVFIATRPDPHGIRGRSGYVVAIARTARHWETKNLAVRSVDDDIDFDRSSCETLTRRQLEEFSLFVFEEFRRRDDHLFSYESFEVGARLDIGVADDDQGRKLFFVNETTRWYNAHYFSRNLCVEPKTRICKAFAESFSDYVRNRMPNVP